MSYQSWISIVYEFKKSYGSYLRNARLAKGLTQRELAKYLAVSTTQVTKWELGNSYPNSEELFDRVDEILGAKMKDRKYHDSERLHSPRTYVWNSFQNLFILFSNTASIMSSKQLKTTFLRFNRRIGEFDEDKKLLAKNVAMFLSGDLSLDAMPENGLRPLRHYTAPWSPKIEDWYA